VSAEDKEPGRLVAPEELGAWAEAQRASGRRIVLTNGCFDLLHDGHVRSILEASRHGDVLLVAINNDASVRALKGEGRPLLPESARSLLLRSLRAVDAVTIFADSSVLPTIMTVRPDVVAKGGQYEEAEIVGSQEVKAWGGRVVRLPMVEGISTTQLLARIRELAPGAGSPRERGGKEDR
jgi:D-beta-D-heptose 7-phosphate kinase/D-beta-D-heptose 1-phosphate adenosyltransferase